MAIASKKISNLPKELPIVEEMQERRKSTFTALVPETRIDSLLKYVEGSPWTVTYYGQLLNTNSTINHFDIKEGNLSQSYVEIKDMILKVQSPLSYSYDEEQGESILTGSAIVPFKVLPQPGDVFIANVDTGEDVLFSITTVERKTHRKDTLYEINYTSLVYVNDHPEFISAIRSRINETYYYDNAIDSKFTNLLVTPTEKYHIDKLRAFLYDSKEYYFRTFKQRASSSLAVPGLDFIAFDQILNEFIMKTVDVSLFDTTSMYSYSNYSDSYLRDTIFDCLIKKVMPVSKRIERQFGFFPTGSYFKRAQLHSGYFSHVNYLICPIEADNRMVSRKRERTFNETDFPLDVLTEDNYDSGFNIYINVKGTDGEDVKKLLPDMFVDNYYVVSENFYNYLEDKETYKDLSYIELIIYRYLKGDRISHEEVFHCATRWEDWNYLHQFYYLPVVWFLVRQALGVL